ncbi:MSMEG_0570 family nitrogen starvation response protein [Massilia arenae]|uniref:MSMEG_0570 family nitrogen starvation response protein n=1 Tax=Massilia arenae TaxID=2603288 RepID=A0A5C7FZI3_9BURK|nr:MSMEG_0570 family nitrogen starvation response protein [Massilia arenae]TXF96337.1 MSMEG_0570 family nitrogen starvation response protein [Massilia arenae]
MPEVRFLVRWPDASTDDCYSPSTAIKEHLDTGTPYALADFLARSRSGLTAASERVRAKYGFACSSAMDQLARIERKAAAFRDDGEAVVQVERFSP